MSVILHMATIIVLVILAYTDPGMLPKILVQYEKKEYANIPMDPRYETGIMRDVRRTYVTPNKTHNLRLKFCNSCYIYRPPRTSHCYDCNSCV